MTTGTKVVQADMLLLLSILAPHPMSFHIIVGFWNSNYITLYGGMDLECHNTEYI
jgi:hypothetical protein